MKHYSLSIEFHCGTKTETCCEEAIELANKMGCAVEFDYNDIRCHAWPGSDPLVFAENIRAEIPKRGKHLVAFSTKLGEYPLTTRNP